MVIYLDQAFLINSLLDYLLMVVCGSVTASPLRRGRIALAAGLGGLYAVLSLLPALRFLAMPWCQLLLAVLMTLTAFGTVPGVVRRVLVLLLLAAAFSGIVLVLTELFSAPAALVGRRIYYPVSFGTLALTGGGAYALMKWGLSRLGHQGGDVVTVTVRHRGRQTVITALRDTGNTLTDPVSGCPVLVANGELLPKLLPELSVTGDSLRHPAELIAARGSAGLGLRLIPYRTVGVNRGLLLAFKPEEVIIAGKREAMLMAFSPVPVSDGGGYQALLGGTL